MLTKSELEELYLEDRMSMMEMAVALGRSPHKIEYWMTKHQIKRRSISEAIYLKNNPNGDPFTIKKRYTKSDLYLLGLGIGLYWGEGNKANPHSVRLGNTDAELLKMFIKFLVEIFNVKKEDMRFNLQIFSDLDVDAVLDYWIQELEVEEWQFYKPTVTISGSIGTYRRKSEHGVVSVYYHNKKLRDILVGMLPR
jgi:hypothetical protein